MDTMRRHDGCLSTTNCHVASSRLDFVMTVSPGRGILLAIKETPSGCYGSRRRVEHGIAAGPLRSDRTGSTGRRGAWRLSGRRLSSIAGSRPGARLGVGVSIGAHQCAIIAGNPPRRGCAPPRILGAHHRTQDLAFYAGRRRLPPARNMTSSWMTIMQGQPGFFKPHQITLAQPRRRQTATSYYDSAPLRETLLELVDFALINEHGSRFSVGAVNVLNGNFVYFDNRERDQAGAYHGERRLAPGPADGQDRDRLFLGRRHRLQHAVAASARSGRPPQLAGLSGRPVQRRGALPRDIQDVMARHKDIMYSSRTRYNTDVFREDSRTWKHRTPCRTGAVPKEDQTEDEAVWTRRWPTCPSSPSFISSISRRPMRAMPRTMSFPAPRCASIGSRAMRTRRTP